MPTSILFVDDESDFEQLIRLKYRRELRREEFEFSFAVNGVDALAKLDARARPYDLIVTDINMPEMSGLELLHELQRRAPGIPVLIMSAYGDMANVRAAMNAGAFDFLTKPVDFTDLDTTRDAALRHRAEARAQSSVAEASTGGEPSAAAEPDEMSMLGLLVAGIVHELKNPLSFVSTFAKLSDELLGDILDGVGEGRDSETAADLRAQIQEVKLTVSKILKHSDWALRIVGSMLEGAAGESREIDLNAVISDHVDLFAASMRAQEPTLKVTINKQLDPDVGQVSLAPQKLVRVLINLLENAYHAVRDRSRSDERFAAQIQIETRARGELVELCVSDNGPGIPKVIRDKIFKRHFTTKRRGEGNGLGLHVVQQIVGDNAGEVSVEDNEPCGARLRVLLPTLASDPQGS